MPKGRLRIRQKADNSLSRFIRLSGSKELSIPAKFMLELEMHNLECEYELEPSGAIGKIIVDGKEVPINNDQAEQAEARRLARQKEEEARKKEELAQRQQERQSFSGNRNNQASEEIKPDRVFNISEFSKLPFDARDVIETAQEKIDNLALRIMKGANFWPDNKNKATLYQKTKGSRNRGTNDQVMSHLPLKENAFDFGGLPFSSLCEQTLTTAQALYPQVLHQHFQTSGRFVTGIGGASVFEVGFTLHHIYGVPYIPASSIKGITRSWMIQQQFKGSEAEALQNQNFCDLFGCPAEWIDARGAKHKSWYALNPISSSDNGERKGKIVFFDAFPLGIPLVEEDVMNVHYPKYYQGSSAPTDHQQPVPVPFLTVSEKTPFRFVMALQTADHKDKQLLEKGLTALGNALMDHGIGAKTAVGYGYMENIKLHL